MNLINCIEIAEKKIPELRIYIDEPCGCKSKKVIKYTLNEKETIKPLCLRHYKSVTNWLTKIKVNWEEIQNKKSPIKGISNML